MSVPNWYEAALLALAAWRVFQLLAADTILDRPRDWALKRIKKHERQVYWHLFLTCPYCLGAWVSLVVYLFWTWLPHATLVVGTLALLNAVVVVMDKALSTE